MIYWSKLTYALTIIAMGGAGFLSAQEKADSLQAPYIWSNCSLISTLSFFALAQVDCDPAAIGGELSLGQIYERPTNLAVVASVLRNHGFEAVGCRSKELVEVLESVEKNNSLGAIVHLRYDKASRDHFACVTKIGEKWAMLDYPRVESESKEHFVKSVSPFFGGVALLVSRETKPKVGAPEKKAAATIQEASPPRSVIQKSDDGRASGTYINVPKSLEVRRPVGVAEMEALEVSFTVGNTGNTELKILKAQGACSCFIGYSGSKLIGPKQTGTVKFTFKQDSTVPVTEVVLGTNDPQMPLARIKINFLDTTPQLSVSTQNLFVTGAKPELFSVLYSVDNGEKPQTFSPHVEYRGKVLDINPVGDDELDNYGGVKWWRRTYSVSWKDHDNYLPQSLAVVAGGRRLTVRVSAF